MRLPENFLQKAKVGLHAIQGFVIFLAWAIIIAIFTKDGTTDGRIKYFFALCWFSIPILIYQAAVPQFDRTKRFSNVYAHVALDVLATIFWFAAFIAVATWTRAGITKGVGRPDHKGCDAFAWGGGASKCHLSQAIIVMGVIIFLLFIATSAISVKNLLYYRRNGSLPGATPSHNISHPLPLSDEDDQAKYAFSSNPHDEFDEEEEHGGNPYGASSSGGRREDAAYEVLHDQAHQYDHDNTLHPDNHSWNNPSVTNLQPGHVPYDPDDIDTSYHPSNTGAPHLPPHRDPFRDRSPSPYRVQQTSEVEDTSYRGRYGASPHPPGQAGDPFRDDAGRVDFPEGHYDRGV
ncbi:MAG: hypothetical protein LQ351_003460 [Letrouitia transgressa]|nr:MAG: hypothetical protein LQ351_003460 [Letrouitia transgressa]